jgi:glycosyltransferase involved in cell wall biosynthesis
MRVAAYTGGVMVPSARARVRQYIKPLGELGITVREYPLPLGNILPRQLALRPMWMATTAVARAAALACSWKADVTWISRQLLPAFTPLHGMAKRPMILDVDDAVWLNTGGHRARDLARACQLVVCGNNFLANQFSRWNSNVIVIPTAVNTSWYRPHHAVAEGGFIMGWTGTSGNFPFLYAIEDALMRVFQSCGRAKLLIVADRPPRFQLLPPSRVEFQPWTPRTELAAFARMSIGLMPLADNDWCNGKCSYKMLCYMAAGMPVVVTGAGMNREVLAMGEVGMSAGAEREWVDALTTLLQDAALRRRMGAAGRIVIEQHFSLDRLAQQYAVLFQSLGPKSQGITSPALLCPAPENDRPTEGTFDAQRHSLIPCPAQ